MKFDAKLSFDFFGELSFERLGGTPSEDKAVKIIQNTIKKIGGKSRIEKFNILTAVKGIASVEVLKPYKKKYEARPVGLTGQTPPKGSTFDLAFIDSINSVNIKKAKGKAIIGYQIGGKKHFDIMKGSGVSSIIHISEPFKPRPYGKRTENFLKQYRHTPSVTIDFDDGQEIVARKASKVKLVIRQEEKKAVSKNIIAEVKGTDKALDEEIVICGHYDSVPESPGAHDNAGGSAIMMGLYKYFLKNPPLRDLKFIWFSSEEQGLLGSQAYAKKHAKTMDRVKMVINIDVAGGLLGRNGAVITGKEDLKHFVKTIGDERGLDMIITEAAYSSDSVPFSWYEVPSINIYRSGASTFGCHSPWDEFKWCSQESIETTGNFSLEIVDRLGNAHTFPFEKGFNDTVKKSLKDYYENRMLITKQKDKLPKW